MSKEISLKEAERKVFTSTVQDGLWDILIGCVMLEFAIGPVLSQYLGDFWSSAVFLPFWGLVYLAILFLRKYIVKPRLGEVTFSKMRQARLVKFNIVMLIVNIIALILGIIVALNYVKIPKQGPPFIFGFILLIGFSLVAFILKFDRLYVYGLLAGFAPIIGEWLYNNFGASHHGLPITFGVLSVIMILFGIFLFTRFMINNPTIEIEALENDQSIR